MIKKKHKKVSRVNEMEMLIYNIGYIQRTKTNTVITLEHVEFYLNMFLKATFTSNEDRALCSDEGRDRNFF